MPAPDEVTAALDLHDRAGCFCCDNLPAIYADKDGAYHDAIYQSRIDLLKAARAANAAKDEAVKAADALMAHVNGQYQFCDEVSTEPYLVSHRCWRKMVDAYRAARAKAGA